MLTLNTILGIWSKYCGAEIGVALDRHDNSDHRAIPDVPAVHYEPKPGEPFVTVCLDYDSNGDIVQK